MRGKSTKSSQGGLSAYAFLRLASHPTRVTKQISKGMILPFVTYFDFDLRRLFF